MFGCVAELSSESWIKPQQSVNVLSHNNCCFCFQTSQEGPGYRKWHGLYPEFNGRHQCAMLQATGGRLHLWPQDSGAETLPGGRLAAPQSNTAWGLNFNHPFVYSLTEMEFACRGRLDWFVCMCICSPAAPPRGWERTAMPPPLLSPPQQVSP